MSGDAAPKLADLQSGTESLLDLVFNLPVWFGLGDHWKLRPSERAEISKQLHACLKRFPKAKTAKFAKVLDKYAPFVALAMVLYAAIAPRLNLTKELQSYARNDATGSDGSGSAAAGNDASTGGATAGGVDWDISGRGTGDGHSTNARSSIDGFFTAAVPIPVS